MLTDGDRRLRLPKAGAGITLKKAVRQDGIPSRTLQQLRILLSLETLLFFILFLRASASCNLMSLRRPLARIGSLPLELRPQNLRCAFEYLFILLEQARLGGEP